MCVCVCVCIYIYMYMYMCIYMYTHTHIDTDGHTQKQLWIQGFPGGSDGKASACNAGDPGSIPGSGRSPGEGNGNPLQYSCLENSIDEGGWQATVHGVAKSRTRLSDFTKSLSHYIHTSEYTYLSFLALSLRGSRSSNTPRSTRTPVSESWFLVPFSTKRNWGFLQK